MVQLQFWGSVIVIVETEISHEETLQVTLRLYTITHRRYLGIGISHELEPFLPLTIIRHIVIVVSKLIGVNIRFLGIHLLQITIILLANIIVWDAQYHLVTARSLDGQHAIIEE